MDLDDLITETQDVISERVQPVLDALACVECVETMADAKANILDALSEARRLVGKLEELHRSLKA